MEATNSTETAAAAAYERLCRQLVLKPLSDEERSANNLAIHQMFDLGNVHLSKSKGSRTGGRLVRANKYTTEDDHTLWSFRCAEHAYKQHNSELPFPARGLFARVSPDGPPGTYEIAIRGYNKFFSISEVPETRPEALQHNTHGPYEVTQKENGCILFAAALTPHKLLVTSKNCLGEGERSHAAVGMVWLKHHLAGAGRTEAELAQLLHNGNLTAVFELCDDEFEEHILAYTGSHRGLYLHGVNRNTTHLDTWPSEQVQLMAKAFGFRSTFYCTFNTLQEARNYCDCIRQHHAIHEGRAVEGFVVRAVDNEGRTFFYKDKFDEPYLMYREWRELTRQLLANRGTHPRYAWTVHYLDWCRKKIKEDPDYFAGYGQGHGIIKARNDFIEYWRQQGKADMGADKLPSTGTTEKQKRAQKLEQPTAYTAKQEEHPPVEPSPDTTPTGPPQFVLVPIATIGCGKTVLSRVISKLLDFEHIQSDDMTGRRKRDAFHDCILKALARGRNVIADRNNHQFMHRESLCTAVKERFPHVQCIALHYDMGKQEKVLEVTTQRVRDRGENHQTLTPLKTKNFEWVMRRFMSEFEPFDQRRAEDAQLSRAVKLYPLSPPYDNVLRVMRIVCPLLGVPVPSNDTVKQTVREVMRSEAAAEKSTTAAPTDIHVVTKPVPTYYAIAVQQNIAEQTSKYFAQLQLPPPDILTDLFQSQRIQTAPHITLVHIQERKRTESGAQLWTAYRKSTATQPDMLVTGQATHLVWDQNVMALAVQLDHPSWVKSCNQHPHITLGTRSQEIRPREANDLLLHTLGSDAAPPLATDSPFITQVGQAFVIHVKQPWLVTGPIVGMISK